MPEQAISEGAGICLAGSCAKRGRFWAVTDAAGQLVCLAVYKKGAQEVLRRLTPSGHTPGVAAETESEAETTTESESPRE